MLGSLAYMIINEYQWNRILFRLVFNIEGSCINGFTIMPVNPIYNKNFGFR
jgi:hypothetical protein